MSAGYRKGIIEAKIPPKTNLVRLLWHWKTLLKLKTRLRTKSYNGCSFTYKMRPDVRSDLSLALDRLEERYKKIDRNIGYLEKAIDTLMVFENYKSGK